MNTSTHKHLIPSTVQPGIEKPGYPSSQMKTEMLIQGGRYPGSVIGATALLETTACPLWCRECLCSRGRCVGPLGIFPSGISIKFLANIDKTLSLYQLSRFYPPAPHHARRNSRRRLSANIRVRFAKDSPSRASACGEYESDGPTPTSRSTLPCCTSTRAPAGYKFVPAQF